MSLAFALCCVGLAAGVPEANVILVTVDTLRADRLGLYGCSKPTSPFLDELADESVVFDRLFAQSSFTPPSHASLLTSLYVRQHGLLSWNRLDDKYVTLAEVLRRAGYKTAAVVNLRLLSENGLGQGFDCWKEGATGESTFDAHEINARVRRWLGAHLREKVFLWVHYFDVHAPYGGGDEKVRMLEERHGVSIGSDIGWYNLSPEDRRQRLVTANTVRFMKTRYDVGVTYTDEAMSELVNGLKELGVWGRTLFVVTSDHGESLDERTRSFFAHDPFLYDEVTRVPALVRFPGGQYGGRRIGALVESLDLAPTILSYLGVEAPEQFEGRDLMPMVKGRKQESDVVFSETWNSPMSKAIRTERWKLIWKVRKHKLLLFDLESDPGERHNIAQEHPEVTKRLYDRLVQWADLEHSGVADAPELGEDMVRRLRALGYIRDDSDPKGEED